MGRIRETCFCLGRFSGRSRLRFDPTGSPGGRIDIPKGVSIRQPPRKSRVRHQLAPRGFPLAGE